VSYINQAVGNFEFNGIYSSILCGFKPTDLLKPDTLHIFIYKTYFILVESKAISNILLKIIRTTEL